jgi:phospholipase D1/2
MELLDGITQCKENVAPDPVVRVPSETTGEDTPSQTLPTDDATVASEAAAGKTQDVPQDPSSTGTPNGAEPDAQRRKAARGNESFETWEREEMEKLLGELRGHLGKRFASLGVWHSTY